MILRAIFIMVIVVFASWGEPLSAAAAPSDAQNQTVSLGFGNQANHLIVDLWNGYGSELIAKNSKGQVARDGVGWFWKMTPKVKATTGIDNKEQNTTDDNLFISYGGFIYIANLTAEGTVDNEKFNHAIPISVGLETSEVADKYNSLVEIGYAPIRLTQTPVDLGFNPYVAIYYQVGRKSLRNSEDKTLSRARAELKLLMNGEDYAESGFVKIMKLKVSYDGWYDFQEEKYYRTFDASLQAKVDEKILYDIVKYTSGNGAPNFTKGSQWTTGLTFAF